ncbi:hypothetical protein F5887DRAFT_245442 [Amanita rubescens]|nr:hypothetical protein F5887DRAFT_245442 [Amanita rubescens]
MTIIVKVSSPRQEPEDSGNTQSQELSLTQSQTAPLAGSPPSMTVEPPASLRSPAPTPARPTIISKMRPRTPSSRSESLANLELPHILVMERIDEESHYADVSAPHDSIETDSQEFRKNQQNPVPLKDEVKRNGKAGATTSAPVPYILGGRAEKRLYVLDKRLNSTIEDIEQFTTPEKRTKDGVKPNGDGKSKKTGTSSPESDAIRRHGMELADAARRAKLQSRPPAPKRSLTDILHDRKSMERATAAVRLSALSHLPPSSIETPSSSILVPDSDRGLPEVPEEVVQEMERAYVNLDGGINNRTDDDTLEDSGPLSRPVEGVRTVLAVRHEEEESTQDLLQEAKAAVDQAEGAQGSGADAVPMDGIEAPEVMALDDKIVSDMLQTGEAEALPTNRADKLVALLQQERTRNQNLHEEIASLRRALELAKGSTSSSELGQRLKDVEVALEQEKVTWNAERTSLLDAVENVTKGKESALKDIDFFREQYARASGFVTSTREENKELEKRAKIAEDQAKSGVAMIKATYENKVKELERHMEKWQTMATFLIQKDYRTENDQLRRRAAEHPELKAKCWSLEANVSFLTSEISQLGKDRDRMESELDYWKQEAERVSTELNNSRVEMERFIQASTSGEMVYRCLWRTDENKPCDEVVQTIEELRNHLYSAGHLRLD